MPSPTPLLKGFAKTIAALKPHPLKRIAVADPDTRGLFVRVTQKGRKTFTVVARDPKGRQVWAALGSCDDVTLEEARERASEGVKRIKAGLGAFPKAPAMVVPSTFEEVSERFLRLYVRKEGQKGEKPLRSAREIERIFARYLLPRWGKQPFTSVGRGSVTDLLDELSIQNGPVMADAVLAQLSSMFTWYASRTSEYTSPIVRGMKRTRSRDRARIRVLTDLEVRAIWAASADFGAFGAFVRVSLLTAQRRAKVANMKWEDLSNDGTWTIPAERGEKGNAESLRLPPLALDILRTRPRVEGNPFVFAGRGSKPIAGFSACKRELDKQSGVTGWVLHDLRRTAKTLMRRARVDRDLSERVLGHVIQGVEGVYDRHDYSAEKAEALHTLAETVAAILRCPNR